MKLKLVDVSKKVSDTFSINNISFEVQNEVVGLIGPSGSGKTTLLLILQGLTKLDKGKIFLDNIDITNLHASKKEISLLIQDYPFITHLNIYYNLSYLIDNNLNKYKIKDLNSFIKNQIKIIHDYYNSYIKNNFNKSNEKEYINSLLINKNVLPIISRKYFKYLSKNKIDILFKTSDLNNLFTKREINKIYIENEIINISKKTKTLHLLYKYPNELSLGEKQRLKLSFALIRKPKVLLLDEAISNVDPIISNQIIEELKDLFNELNIPVIYVSHNQDEIDYLCSKIIILNEGKIVQIGSKKEIENNPNNIFISEFYHFENNNLLNLNLDMCLKYMLNYSNYIDKLQDKNNVLLVKNDSFEIVKNNGLKLKIKKIDVDNKLIYCSSNFSLNNRDIKIKYNSLKNIDIKEIQVKFNCHKFFLN